VHNFSYQNGSLHCEGMDLAQLATDYGTPLYVYSATTLIDHYTKLDQALSPLDHEVAFAVKANSNLSVLNLLAKKGSGFDVVSAGEIKRVIAAGGDPGKCSFAGVAKTREEITFALQQGIYAFNAESEAELDLIDEIAGELGVKAPVALRINPHVDAKTHKYISTGKAENKFGIDFPYVEEAYERASQKKNLHIKGVQMHIGSQLTQVKPFVEAAEKVAPLAARLKERFGIEFWSIGGGVGIVYDPALESGTQEWWDNLPEGERPLTVDEYAGAIVPILEPLGLKIFVEPGRYIAGNAGVLLTSCVYEKKGTEKVFKIVDAGMNDLIRPALYEGHHEIVPVKESISDTVVADVVGPVCETGDFFCQNREVADVHAGDTLALMSAGAYGFVMASVYNTRPYPAEVLVTGNEAKVIRPRQTVEDILGPEQSCL